MAEIKPFKGFRYDSKRFKDLSRLTAPPYDVIDDALQDELYSQSRFNVIRLILGRELSSDTPDNNRYTRARNLLAAWIREGVVQEEPSPALYVYDQRFKLGGRILTRRTLVAAVKLERYGEGGIFPHENTMPGHKEDRLRLMRATRFNTSSVFAFFADPDGSARSAIDRAVHGAPDDFADDPDGVHHRIWTVVDPAAIDAVSEALREKSLFIADGHHRYETALTYRDGTGAVGDGSRGEDYAMITLVAAEDEGLVALPTHRVVHGLGGFSTADLLSRAETHFHVEPASREDLPAIEQEPGEGPATIGVASREPVHGSRCHVLRLKEAGSMDERAGDRKPSWRGLDVSALHLLLLEDVLGIGPEALARHESVRYVRGAADAVGQALAGADGAQAAFIMRPTPLASIMAVAADGERLPQKTTYFYPKLLSGLVFRSIR